MSIPPNFAASQSELTKPRRTRSRPLGLPEVTDEPETTENSRSTPKSGGGRSEETRHALVEEYLERTELLKVMDSLLNNLLSKSELPYNPYPTFIKAIRNKPERFHMFAEENDKIERKLNGTTIPSVGNLVEKESENIFNADSAKVWGLQSLLSVVQVERIQEYSWFLDKLTETAAPPDLIPQDVELSVIGAVIGSSVFLGLLLTGNSVLHVRMEYVITGQDREQAAEQFSQILLQTILKAEKDTSQIFLGFLMPIRSSAITTEWPVEYWTPQRISEEQEEFRAKVQDAASNFQMLGEERFMAVDPLSHQHKYIKKQCSFNFILKQENRKVCISAQPFLTMHEGVFLSYEQARQYQSMFTECVLPNVPQKSTGDNTGGQGRFNRRKKSKESRTQSTVTRPVTGSVPGPVGGSVARSLGGQSERPSQTRQQIANSRRSVKSEVPLSYAGPSDEHILVSIRDLWYEKVTALDLVQNLFDMVPYLVVILLLDRDFHAPVYLTEIYRLFRSTAYKLHSVMSMNSHLLQLIDHFQHKQVLEDDSVQAYFLLYKRTLLQLLRNSEQEKCCELQAAYEVVINMLESLTPVTGYDVSLKLLFDESTVKVLKAANLVCQALLWSLTQDALALTPGIVSFVKNIFIEYVGFDPIRDFRSFAVMYDENVSAPYKHGAEVKQQMRRSKMVLSKVKALAEVQAPAAVKSEAVILQYCVESRIDSTFQDFLSGLVNGSSLPPNPYPRLISELKTAAFRLDLCSESDDKLVASLLHDNARIFDPSYHIYTIPGASVFGTSCSVALLDNINITAITKKIQKFTVKLSSRAGAVAKFKVTVGVSLCGFSPWYGAMSPYLHYVDLDEHFFLQSGKKQSPGDIISHFTKVVYEHIQEVIEIEEILVIGLFLGSEKICWTLRQMSDPEKKQSFVTQLSETVRAKRPIVFRAYIKTSWRFILVDKKLLLHAVTGGRYENYFEPSPLTLYQSVFTSSDVASLYFKHCGVGEGCDPCAGEALSQCIRNVNRRILETVYQANYLDVYRWMLLRSLVNQHKNFASICHKMLHSIAGQLEYLETLNKTLQQIVNEELSRTFLPSQLDTNQQQSVLDQDMLSTMVIAYRQKIQDVLNQDTCFIPESLSHWIKEQFRQIMSFDPLGKEETLIVNEKSVDILESIHLSLVPWKLITARMVHSYFPDAQAALSTILLEVQTSL